MKVAITFDRVDSQVGVLLTQQFGTPNGDTGDTDTTIRGATPGLGVQRTFTYNVIDKPKADLMIAFAWNRVSVRNINLEKVLS